MGLVGSVNYRLRALIAKSRVPHHGESRQVCHASAAYEDPLRFPRKVQQCLQPIQYDEFDLARAGAFEPRSGEHIESAGKRVCHNADEVARSRHEPEKTRVVEVHQRREYVFFQLFKNSFRGVGFR